MPIGKITELFNRINTDDESLQRLQDEELKLASAALLVRASLADGSSDGTEAGKIDTVLKERFDLDQEETTALIEAARKREADSVDLYGCTSVIAQNLDQEGRQKIIEMMWDVVLADGVIDEFEANLVWRTAELIGVSTRDRVRLRKLVESRND